ncbi:hypothetical protein CsatB_001810 [Cannabis sativa]|uniref:DUF7392 domain-containing protein n=1 Tax=Cannabis sativa TaxID=3483 RepID=A0A7J6EXN5_CANSA|nr:uncharacterized protein LOC115697128 [Cannabis sativa]KAF4363086.1 hypothetical protein F8388_013450 [Cannabis sativa]KAF4381879.1 hypothetical protein G4B88_001174 [Cannabis sativa]
MVGACFIPFNNRNLDISIFAFRPTVVLVGDLIEALKHFSLSTETLGCVQSSLLQSIHGNMILWYGAWLKKSCENKESLIATLLSMLNNISTMAILTEHSFFDSYAGESRDSSVGAAKFCRGDTISMCVASSLSSKNDINDLSYACLALFKSNFLRMDGVTSGVCLKSQNKSAAASFYVWKDLQFCYSWILTDQRSSMLPYLERFSLELKYDIFRVVYVSGDDNVVNVAFVVSHPPNSTQMLEKEGESKEQKQVIKTSKVNYLW